MQYEIQKIDENYNPDVLIPTWKEALPDLDERRIKWSYEENPAGKAKLYLLRDLHRHQYFGSCVVIPRNYYYNGKELTGGITADFAIKKEYRTLGPALKMQRTIIDSNDFEILIAFPNRKAEGVQRRAGYKVLGNLVRFIKIFKSAPILKRRYDPFVSLLASPLIDAYLKIRSIKLNRKRYNDVYITNNKLDKKVEKLYEEVKDEFDFIGHRNLKYLTWRFTLNPFKSYYIFSVKENTSKFLIGYIIYSIEDNIAYITDFLCKDSDINLFNLFDSFTLHCKKTNLYAISLTMIENQAYLELFKKSGFFKEETNSKVLYFHERNEILKNKNIFLTMGDCDI